MIRLRPLHAVLLAGLLLVAAWSSPLALLADPASGTLDQAPSVRPEAAYPLRVEVHGHDAGLLFGDVLALDAGRDALLVVAPGRAFGDDEARALLLFLLDGGRAAVADDRGIGAHLVERLGVGVELTGTRVYSPSFVDDPKRLLARDAGLLPNLPDHVALTHPVLVRGGEAVLLVPELAWEDRNANGRPDLGEPFASGAVAATVRVGAGELLVVGDPDVFRGESSPARAALLAHLTDSGRRRLVLDEAHHASADPLGLEPLLGGADGATARTGILMSTLIVAALVVLGPRLRARSSRAPLPMHAADPAVVASVLEELE